MKIKGKNMAVALRWEGDEDLTVVTGATDCMLTISANIVPVSSPLTKKYGRGKAKRKSWKVTTNHLVDLDNQVQMTALLGRKVWLSMAKRERTEDDTWEDITTEAVGFEGWAWVSKVSIQAQNKDLVKGAFEFTGTGKLQMLPHQAEESQPKTAGSVANKEGGDDETV